MVIKDADLITRDRAERAGPCDEAMRIDQAVEFALPDEVCRRRLISLYARGLPIAEPIVTEIATRTAGVSRRSSKEPTRGS